ncbi:MAG: protein kinase [Deltaproteobacteria bacterium]|nr:protein kinase [Deltaproteobacteria bacterium]
MSVGLLSEDQVFANRYRVVRCIATGGMGTVYEVLHVETERRCALKVMLPHIVASDDMRSRFKREARITANIGSEFIVDVLDAGVDEETKMPFIVMEFLDGEDLGEALSKAEHFSPKETVTFLYQAALALNKTHAQGIVHRDLKPENLFLTRRDDGSPRIKILDFGISKVVVEAGTRRNDTMSLGTPLYMAPEQFQGSVSPATDVYALGMIAFTLLVGVAYWHQESKSEQNVFALAGKIVDGPVERPTERARHYGVQLREEFDPWFKRVSERNPKDRFPTAVDAITALAEALRVSLPKPSTGRNERGSGSKAAESGAAPANGGVSHAPTVAHSPDALAEVRGTGKHSKWIPAAVASAVLVTVVAGVGIYLATRGRDSGPPTTPDRVPESLSVTSASPSSAPVATSSPIVVLDSAVPPPGSAPLASSTAAPAETSKTAIRVPAKPPATKPPPTTTPTGAKNPAYSRY